MIDSSSHRALAILQTHNLTKRYGEFAALGGVSLSVRQGDIYGLVGRNGAGKTTFFKCVMGLARPTSGDIEIGGNPSKARQRMGFMISPSFFPYLNAAENLRYHCRVRGIRNRGEVARLLRLVSLDGVKKPYRAFSLGMKNRLGIAAALLGSPQIVVLDEPVNGLDPQGIIDMRAVIRDVHERTGATFLISSHILAELDLVATRFGFIEQGVLLKEITHTDLHEQTKKTLRIEVDDAPRARAALAALGIQEVIGCEPLAGRQRLTLGSHLERTPEIADALVSAGVRLYDLHRQETTLEDYFVRLVGSPEASASPPPPPPPPDGAHAGVVPPPSDGAPAGVVPPPVAAPPQSGGRHA